MRLSKIEIIVGWIIVISLVLLATFGKSSVPENVGASVSQDVPRIADLITQRQIQEGTKSDSVPREERVIIEE